MAAELPPLPELERDAADGFLINGSVNNGAASPFAQTRAFGNNRPGQRTLYSGGVGINLAVQDAVAAANILAAPLRAGTLRERDLAAVERRRRRGRCG